LNGYRNIDLDKINYVIHDAIRRGFAIATPILFAPAVTKANLSFN